MWKQPRFSCRLSFLLNKKKETRASFLPCYSSAQNSNTNFGSQWWSPSPHWLASSALRLFNHPRMDDHEIINNRFIDSSPKRRKIVNQIIFACKINGDADDNTRVVDSSPPSRANTFKAPSKMSNQALGSVSWNHFTEGRGSWFSFDWLWKKEKERGRGKV